MSTMSIVRPPFAARLRDLAVLLVTPQDVATESGRARERQRRIALAALASLFAKVTTVTTGLISVPLTLHYLGPERYGMWMTMSTLVAMLSFADLGIGNGLLSQVARAYGRDDLHTVRALVSSAFVVLTGIAVSVAALFFVAYPFIDWPKLFNVATPAAMAEAGPSFAALFLCFALAIPLGVVQRTQMALQNGFEANLWQAAGSILALGAVVVAIRLEASLPWLVVAFAGTPLTVAVLNSLYFFGRQHPAFAPRVGSAALPLIRSIAGTGVLFLVLQVVSSITNASDGIIVAQVLGPAAVADYSVPQKLFGVIGTVLSMVLAPLWPAYSEAIARGDQAWVRSTLKRSLLLSVGAAAALSAPLVVFGHEIIAAWVGPAIVPSMTLLVSFAAWKLVEAASLPLAMYLNGAQIITTQVIVSLVTCLAVILGRFALTNMFGLPGLLWATIISYILFAIVPYGFLLNRRLTKQGGAS